jgi:acyl phosphate:glycerol-3-phosphate acyltransferase
MKLVEVGMLVGCCLGAYVVGSIPVAYIVARFAGVEDITKHGSGNAGATNTARTLGARYFLPVFALDFAKAYGTVALVAHFFSAPIYFYATALSYLIGNGFSMFLGGKGGKGVAATAGILTFYNPTLTFLTFASWALFFAKTRTVGISSATAAMTVPLFAILLGLPWHGVLFVATISTWIVVRHYENMRNYFAQ